MTISVSPERSTLSLPGTRLRTDQPTLRAGPDGVLTTSHGPKADPSVTVAKTATLDGAALRAVTLTLDRASSIADAGLAASASVIDLLSQIRDAAGRGDDPSSLIDALDEAVRGAGFDGNNLLDGSSPDGLLRVPTGPGGDAEITLGAPDLRSHGPVLGLSKDASAPETAARAEAAMVKADAAREQLKDDAKRLEAHRAFMSMLSDAVTGGAQSLDVEGARLAALSVKQTIGGTNLALSSAGTPQQVLSLFR